MLNVVCLKWGSKYDFHYVNRLHYAIQRNLTIPFQFHCFTENPATLHKDINIVPLNSIKNIGENISGWWYKPYMFADHSQIQGRVLYLDLDTVITGNIDHLAQCAEDFVVLRDFTWHGNNMGSAVMLWDAGTLTHIWNDFYNNNPQKIAFSFHPHGDQRWIQKVQPNRKYWQDLFPDEVVSYKIHCQNGPPPKAKIVCFHGTPSVLQVASLTDARSTWVKKVWKDSV